MLSWWSHRLTWWFINNLKVDFVSTTIATANLTREAVVVHPSFPNIIPFLLQDSAAFLALCTCQLGRWWFTDFQVVRSAVGAWGRQILDQCGHGEAVCFCGGWCHDVWQFIKSCWVFFRVAREAQEWQVFCCQNASCNLTKNTWRLNTMAGPPRKIHHFRGSWCGCSWFYWLWAFGDLSVQW